MPAFWAPVLGLAFSLPQGFEPSDDIIVALVKVGIRKQNVSCLCPSCS